MSDAILVPPVSARDHIEGNESALVTLVEYADYQCPYCGSVYPVIKLLQKSLGKKLRFVFRNFPLAQSHRYAMIAAEAAEAAALQGKFWQMHKLLFENQEELKPDVLPSWAESIGVDINQFAMAIKDRRVRKRIEDDYASGVQSGVEGTPGFFINGMTFDGDHDFESLHAVLLEVASRV